MLAPNFAFVPENELTVVALQHLSCYKDLQELKRIMAEKSASVNAENLSGTASGGQ